MAYLSVKTLFRYSFTKKIFFSLYPPLLIKNLTVLSWDQILDAMQDGVSIVRFGDGEISILTETNNPKFQPTSEKLRESLKTVFTSDLKKLLVCIPSYVHNRSSFDSLSFKAQYFWYRFLEKQHEWFEENLQKGRSYGDTQITRPYIDIQNKQKAEYVFTRIKELFCNKEVVIIEGVYTRFGVDNDLLARAKSVSRIIAPAVDAFSAYSQILSEALRLASPNTLFVLCLGPAAKVLALDLVKKGYQVWDLGHLDIEYEWFRRGAEKKILIPGKYVNEVQSHITEDPFEFYEPYLNQVKVRIK